MPALSANVPSESELRIKLLMTVASRAASYQHHENPLCALRVTVRPSGWRQALLRRSRSAHVWLMMDTPFDGLCLGEDRLLYMLDDDDPVALPVTRFEITSCTLHDIDRVTEVLFEMCAPAIW
jgi:hypothetical protein